MAEQYTIPPLVMQKIMPCHFQRWINSVDCLFLVFIFDSFGLEYFPKLIYCSTIIFKLFLYAHCAHALIKNDAVWILQFKISIFIHKDYNLWSLFEKSLLWLFNLRRRFQVILSRYSSVNCQRYVMCEKLFEIWNDSFHFSWIKRICL